MAEQFQDQKYLHTISPKRTVSYVQMMTDSVLHYPEGALNMHCYDKAYCNANAVKDKNFFHRNLPAN